MSGDPFRVRVKASAVARNAAVADRVRSGGDRLTFPDREAAAAYAARATREGSAPVALQQVAPQDPDAVDAYLVAAARETAECESGARWRVGVTGNQYGALAEALLRAEGGTRGLHEYVERDLDLGRSLSAAGLAVRIEGDVAPLETAAGRWTPDARLVVAPARVPDLDQSTLARFSPGADGTDADVPRAYLLEVKAGNATPERGQEAAMRAAAGDRRVLLVDVDVSDLPAAYVVTVRRVAPE